LTWLTTGHYGCGGCVAALGNKRLGLIDNWLRHIRDVRAANAEELDSLEDINQRTNRLAELKYEFFIIFLSNCSVLAQVNSMKRIPTVQEAMEQRGLQVHGWVYDVSNGHIKPLKTDQDVNQAVYEVKVSDGSVE
jgi:carbonic anhydrase